MDKDIQKIISNTGKAELLEMLSELLKQDGARCLVLIGVPRENNSGIDITTLSHGFSFAYEQSGFMAAGADILFNDDIGETEREY